jgi:hypothetical protein
VMKTPATCFEKPRGIVKATLQPGEDGWIAGSVSQLKAHRNRYAAMVPDRF